MPNDRKLLVLLIVVLVLLAVFTLPVFPYAAGFTVYPSALFFVAVVILVLLIAAGQI